LHNEKECNLFCGIKGVNKNVAESAAAETQVKKGKKCLILCSCGKLLVLCIDVCFGGNQGFDVGQLTAVT